MAESVQERWGCNDDEAIRRRAYSSGKEDVVEACKILGWKDKVGKSHAGLVMIKLTWLDHVEPVICRSHDHDITKSLIYPWNNLHTNEIPRFSLLVLMNWSMQVEDFVIIRVYGDFISLLFWYIHNLEKVLPYT